MPNLNGCDEKMPKHYMPDMKCVPLRHARRDSWFNLSKSEVIGFARPAYTLVTGAEISDPVRLPDTLRETAGTASHAAIYGHYQAARDMPCYKGHSLMDLVREKRLSLLQLRTIHMQPVIKEPIHIDLAKEILPDPPVTPSPLYRPLPYSLAELQWFGIRPFGLGQSCRRFFMWQNWQGFCIRWYKNDKLHEVFTYSDGSSVEFDDGTVSLSPPSETLRINLRHYFEQGRFLETTFLPKNGVAYWELN